MPVLTDGWRPYDKGGGGVIWDLIYRFNPATLFSCP